MGRPLLAHLYGQGLPQTPFREVPWAPAHATLLPRVLGEQSVDGAENGDWWGGRSAGAGRPGSRADHNGQGDQVCLCPTEHIPGE